MLQEAWTVLLLRSTDTLALLAPHVPLTKSQRTPIILRLCRHLHWPMLLSLPFLLHQQSLKNPEVFPPFTQETSNLRIH